MEKKDDDALVVGYSFSGARNFIPFGTENTNITDPWITNKTNTSNILESSGLRYDYVLVAFKNTFFDKCKSLTITDRTTMTLTPADGIDVEETQRYAHPFTWNQPAFGGAGGGGFGSFKRADETYRYQEQHNAWPRVWYTELGMQAGNYSSYNLTDLYETNQNVEDLDYALELGGYTGSSTLDPSYKGSATDPEIVNSLWKMPVRYTIEDDEFYLTDESDGISTDEKDRLTSSADFQIDYLRFSVYAQDGAYDDTNKNIYGKAVTWTNGSIPSGNISAAGTGGTDVSPFPDQQTDIVYFYAKYNSTDTDYVLVASYNLATGEWSTFRDGVTGSGDTLDFGDNCVGYKMETFGAHYYERLAVVPSATLKASSDVKSRIKAESTKDESGTTWNYTTDSLALNNRAYTCVTDYHKASEYAKDGQTLSEEPYSHEIYSRTAVTDADFIRRAHKNTSLAKEVVSNTLVKKQQRYELTWHVTFEETYLTGSGDEADKQYIEQQGGTFYDLLPLGATLNPSSILVLTDNTDENGLRRSSYRVTQTENYKGSGRVLLTFTIYDEAKQFEIYYDTYHTYQAIRDYGYEVYNSVAYKTNNERLSPYETAGGQDAKDEDAYAYFSRFENVNDNENTEKTNEEKSYIYSVGADANSPSSDGSGKYTFPANNGSKLIYYGYDYDISSITAAASGLSKRIHSESTSGYVQQAFVKSGTEYSYRLRYQNSYSNKSKNLIIYDSLEKYYAKDGQSAWTGTLKSINFPDIPKDDSGKDLIVPKVYYATQKITVSRDALTKNEADLDLSDSSIWTLLTSEQYGNLSSDGTGNDGEETDTQTYLERLEASLAESGQRITAIAVDMTGVDGQDPYILDKGKALTVVLNMVAPKGADTETTGTAYPEAYNGASMKYTRITDARRNNEQVRTGEQGFTTARLVVSRDINILKISSKDSSTKIRDIQFRLTGTSDYGTAVDEIETSDYYGRISFSDIEKGTYTLMEYGRNPDWLEDHTLHTVKVLGTGELRIYDAKISDDAVGKDTGLDGVTIGSDEDGKYYSFATDVHGDAAYYNVTNDPRVHTDVYLLKAREATEDDDSYHGVNGAQFRLEGTSDYGNKILKLATSAPMSITNGSSAATDGVVYFEDVEKGTYTVTEIKENDEYLPNANSYRVVVDEAGSASVFIRLKTEDGRVVKDAAGEDVYEAVDKVGGRPVIYNTPKYWDFSFRKVDASLPSKTLEGAKFTLTGAGITDAGREEGTYTVASDTAETSGESASNAAVTLVSTSNSTGTVSFTHLPAGSYILKETAAPAGVNKDGKLPSSDATEEQLRDYKYNYTLDPTEYIVTITEKGVVTIKDSGGEELEKQTKNTNLAESDSNKIYVFPDEQALDQEITVYKIWNDGNADDSSRPIPVVHLKTSDAYTSAKTAVVTVVWENDSRLTRPSDNFSVVLLKDGVKAAETTMSDAQKRGNIWTFSFPGVTLDGTSAYSVYEDGLALKESSGQGYTAKAEKPDGTSVVPVNQDGAVPLDNGRASIVNEYSYVTDYAYTGSVQTFTPQVSGTYKLEVWGAQGGYDVGPGGKGGYSSGMVELSASDTLYIYVGQKGGDRASGKGGGWNGGGDAGVSGWSGGGGGMTHISTAQNLVDNGEGIYANVRNNRASNAAWDPRGTLIVAGGGGGAYGNGGFGGGETAGGGSTQAASNAVKRGFKQGYGQDKTYYSDGAGGGAGWYGGYAANGDSEAGGGTGYVDTDGSVSGHKVDGSTVAGNQLITEPNGTSSYGHTGNGYARITFLSDENTTDTSANASAGKLSSYDAEYGYMTYTDSENLGGWEKVDDNTWKYVLNVADADATYTVWEDGSYVTTNSTDDEKSAAAANSAKFDGYSAAFDAPAEKANSGVTDGSGSVSGAYTINCKQSKVITVTNTNTSNSGSLTVSKTVVDSENNELTDSTQDFTFTLTLSGPKIRTSGVQSIGGIAFDCSEDNQGMGQAKASFTLHEGQSRTFTGIPVGTQYSVSEAAAEHYTTSTSEQSGTITAEASAATVAFTNTLDPPPETKRADVTLTKEITGSTQGSENDEYAFTAILSGLESGMEYYVTNGGSATEGDTSEDDQVGSSETTLATFIATNGGTATVNVNLKAGEKAVFKGLPEGAHYQFVEEAGNWVSSFTAENAKEEDGTTVGSVNQSSGENTDTNTQLATAEEVVEVSDGTEGLYIPEKTTVTFTNELSYTQSLTIAKDVTATLTQPDANETFEITLNLSGMKAGTRVVSGNRNVSGSSVGVMVADDTGEATKTFTLRNGKSVTFHGIPVGAKYSVTETSNKYKASYTITDGVETDTDSGATTSADTGSKETVLTAEGATGENDAAYKDLTTVAQTMVKGTDPHVHIHNEEVPGTLKIVEEVHGNAAEYSRRFRIGLTIKELTNQTVNGQLVTVNKASDASASTTTTQVTVTFDENGTVSRVTSVSASSAPAKIRRAPAAGTTSIELADGESITLEVPVGAVFTVKEEDLAGRTNGDQYYTTQMRLPKRNRLQDITGVENGTVLADAERNVYTFVNTRNKVNLAKVDEDGNSLEGAEFLLTSASDQDDASTDEDETGTSADNSGSTQSGTENVQTGAEEQQSGSGNAQTAGDETGSDNSADGSASGTTVTLGNASVYVMPDATYTLTETKAPEGYSAVGGSLQFALADRNTGDVTYTLYDDNGVAVATNVESAESSGGMDENGGSTETNQTDGNGGSTDAGQTTENSGNTNQTTESSSATDQTGENDSGSNQTDGGETTGRDGLASFYTETSSTENDLITWTFTVANAKLIDISGTKTWDDNNNQDGARPESITLRLLANGTEVRTATVTAEGTTEKDAGGDDSISSGTSDSGASSSESAGSTAATDTVNRTESTAVSDTAHSAESTSDVSTDENTWKYTFTGVPKYENGQKIVYTVTEDAVEDYTTAVSGWDVTNSHTPGERSITVTKKWDDESDKDGIRPVNVTVSLLADGKDTGKTVILSAANNWSVQFTGLAAKSGGKEISYTVSEAAVRDYTAAVSGDMTKGYIITNSHLPKPEEEPKTTTKTKTKTITKNKTTTKTVTKTTTTTTTTTKNTKTGDTTRVELWLLLAIAAALLAAEMILDGRRKRSRRK